MDINEIVAEKTKDELIKFIQKDLNSSKFDFCVEYGSKAGNEKTSVSLLF